MKKLFLQFTLIITFINWSLSEIIHTTVQNDVQCDRREKLIGNDCVGPCSNKNCGENATCYKINGNLICKCLRGYTGDARMGCFKMDEEHPCAPSPCGPNSICVEEDANIGPHCKCMEGFFDYPPNCRSGCSRNSDCKENHACSSTNYCVDLCADDRCGLNSICRVDQEKLIVHCSCQDGFIPEKGIGCREKNPEDFEIPLESLMEAITDPCGDKCGENAYCSEDTRTCVCAQGYTGDPEKECSLIEFNSIDVCSPNPCGPYSKCTVVDEEYSCSCIDGFLGDPPSCTKCESAVTCEKDQLCVGGKCVDSPCTSFCGDYADCNIFDGKIACSCQVTVDENSDNPFDFCTQDTDDRIPPSVIATLLG